jgi:photosystem II stability/assembly factor-like uncharacterized protein
MLQRDSRCLLWWLWTTTAVISAMSVSSVADAGQGVWTSGGPYSGDVYALAINPTNPATLYAGTNGDGVFKSTDSGGTWAAARTGLTAWSAVYALAINPMTPATLYAGADGGVFKSTDSGGTWAAASTGLPNVGVSALAINPATPSTLYAATFGSGVFKSTDSGGTWAAASTGLTGQRVQALAINPTTPSTLYAGTEGGGVCKSTDSGGTWAAASTGLTTGSVYALAISPTNPATLYAGADGQSGHGVVFKSTDSGGTWAVASTGLTTWSVQALAINPMTPSTLYAGTPGGGVFKSTDSGSTWAASNAGPTSLYAWALAINPSNPATLYAGTWGDWVFKSTDSGGTWAPTGPTNLSVEALAINPATPTTLYAGTWNSGVFKSTDSGATWAAASAGLRDVFYLPVYPRALAINPTTPATLYAGLSDSTTNAKGGVFKSTDSGGTWVAANNGLASTSVVSLAINPATPTTLYAGTWDSGVFKSTDSGGTWTAINTGLTNLSVVVLAINPRTPDTLYVSTEDPYSFTPDAEIFKSTDSGGTWTAANKGLPISPIFALAINPTNPATLYAGTNFGVFKSTDSGVTWAAANTPQWQVTALAINPSTPATLYAGTNFGVFKSTDSGGTWASAAPGLPRCCGVSALALDPTGPTTLYAGIAGGSVWQLSPPDSARSVVPIVLDVDTGSAHYTTELALSNASGAQNASLTYTPSLGTRVGGGTVPVSLPAGQQVVYPNIITALRTLGLQIPEASASAPQGGTLTVTYDPRIGSVYATARTTTATAAPQPVGNAGLAYGGLPATEAITTRGVVYGLRSTDADRSNLAVYNAGTDPVTVKVTLFSGSGDGRSAVVSDGVTLPAFGWYQFDRVLAGVGMTNAWALLERTSATGAFGAYGVINDNTTNDGSFVALVSEATNGSGMTLPVLVETGGFTSEIVLANKGGTDTAKLTLNYAESLTPALGAGGIVNVWLAPGEQRIIAGAIDFLRTNGAAIGAKGAASYAGAVRVSVSEATLADVYVGVRTAAASAAGGQFGLFTPPVYAGQEALGAAAIYGLKADALSRTNIAVLNAGADAAGPVTLRLDIHDGSAGGAVKGTLTVTLNPGQWAQPGNFFGGSGVANGYVTVTRTAGTAPWIAYGVVNDGGAPGQRTGDGAYVAMTQ